MGEHQRTPRAATIPSISCLSTRPSNSSAGYCRACFSSAIMCAEIFSQFNALRLDGELCDVDILVNSSPCNAPAHRLILATKSPYFKRYFVENKTATEFEFDASFSAEGVRSVLEYMYDNELVVSSENVEDLTKIAVFLELADVVDRCCQFMTKHFSNSNYEYYIYLAEELNLPWLLDKVFLFLEWNFVEMVETEGFLRLTPSQLQRLISGKVLRVGREETLYAAVMKWYNHDTTSRKESLENLFTTIDFLKMNPNFLEERVLPELVNGLGICEDKVSSALDQKTPPAHVDTPLRGRYRNTSDVIYIFSSSEALVERFDQVTCTNVPCPQMKRGAIVSGNGDIRMAVIVKGELFLVSSRRVLRYNADEMRWATFSDGVPVVDAGVCGGVDSIYVVGGKESKAVKRFLIEKHKWDNLPPMNTGRRGPGVICHNNVLYVMGGYNTDRSGPVATVESLDLASEKWSLLSPMRVPRFRLSCAVLDGHIFAMGGRDNVRNFLTVETLDIESKIWHTPDKHMVRARDEFCATVQEGKIFCFGGRGEQNIECFDPNSGGIWKEIGVMGEGKSRTGLSCATFNPVFDDLNHQI